MNRLRLEVLPGMQKTDRRGFISLGPLREVIILSTVIGVILGGVVGTNLYLKKEAQGNDEVALKPAGSPVRGLEIDCERQTLLVHSWPNDLCEIELSTGQVKNIDTPEAPYQVSDIAVSKFNSVSIIVTDSTNSKQYRERIHVFRNGELIRALDCPSDINSLSEVTISADGSIAALISDSGTVVGIDLTSKELTQWQFNLPCASFSSGLSPDGQWIYSSDGEENTGLYDVRTGVLRLKIDGVQGARRGIAWSNDSRVVAIASINGGVYVVDVSDGHLLWQKKLDFLFARSMALSGDGSQLALSGFEKQIYLWDLAEGSTDPRIVIDVSSVAHNVTFNDSNQTLISGGEDGSIKEWTIATGELLRKLR